MHRLTQFDASLRGKKMLRSFSRYEKRYDRGVSRSREGGIILYSYCVTPDLSQYLQLGWGGEKKDEEDANGIEQKHNKRV